MTTEQLLEVGKQSGDWASVLKKLDATKWSTDEVVALGKKFQTFDLWVALIEKCQLDTQTLITIANSANCHGVWSVVATRIDFSQLSVDQLLQVGSATEDRDNQAIWDRIVAELEKCSE